MRYADLLNCCSYVFIHKAQANYRKVIWCDGMPRSASKHGDMTYHRLLAVITAGLEVGRHGTVYHTGPQLHTASNHTATSCLTPVECQRDARFFRRKCSKIHLVAGLRYGSIQRSPDHVDLFRGDGFPRRGYGGREKRRRGREGEREGNGGYGREGRREEGFHTGALVVCHFKPCIRGLR